MKSLRLSVPSIAASTLLLFASQSFAQTSGTSHPEKLDDTITVAAPQNSTVTVTSPAAIQQQVYVAPVPTAPAAPVARVAAVEHPQLRAPETDLDAGIVTTYPYTENALAEGTLLKARLVGKVSTETTKPGSHFIATLRENVLHDGKVILPVGASLEGRVTEVRSGKRISGGAAVHLQPETVTLPDGTQYRLTAQVIDVDSGHSAKVNEEGTIVGGNHTTGHVVTLGATTGGGAIAGAVIGGGVGAAVGAGVGAGVGTVLWLKQDRQQTLPEGTDLIFSLNRPMMLTPATTAR